MGALGIFYPYYSLYLKENLKFSGFQIGLAMAVLPTIGLICQPLWGYAADRTGARRRILMMLTIGAATGFGAIYFAEDFVTLIPAMLLLALFYTSTIPQGTALSIGLLHKEHNSHFEWVRALGSVGFIVATFTFPALLDAWQARMVPAPGSIISEPGLEVMFPLTSGLLLAAALVVFFIPEDSTIQECAEPGAWRQLASNRPFLRFLFYVFCTHLFLDGPMFMFPIFVRSLGTEAGAMQTLRWMWLLMLVPEIFCILFSGYLRRLIGVRLLLFSGLAAGGIRWLACGLFTGELVVVYAAQVLHGLYVAGALVVMPICVNRMIPGRLRSSGQAMAAMIGPSLGGGILSMLAAGWLVDHAGPTAPQLIGGIGAMVLLALAPLLVQPIPPDSASKTVTDEI